jgi:hypothetical protein
MFDNLSGRTRFYAIAVVIVATLAPPLALAASVYYVAGVRHVAAHLSRTNPRTGDARPGDIIAVTGQVTGKPARLAADVPPMAPALMLKRRFEVYHYGKRGGWKDSQIDVWVSESAFIAGWHLSPELIRRAAFDWRRASPCSEYRPPAGWTAKCPDEKYVVNQADSDLRMSYEITPLTSQEFTLIAAVGDSRMSLVPIASNMSGEAPPSSILAQGVQDPNAVLAQRAGKGIIAVALSWLAVFLDAGIWMFIALGRNGAYEGLERLWGVTWRSAAIGAPLVTFCLGLPPDFVIVADLSAASIAAAIGGFFWFKAIEE